jgi:hypothetical protein
MSDNKTTTFVTMAALMLAVLAGAACDLTKANPAAPTSPAAPTTPSATTPAPTTPSAPAPPAPAVTEWTIEAEDGTGGGGIKMRSEASRQRAVWMGSGMRHTMTWTAPTAGSYSIALRLSNDNGNPNLLEDVVLTIDDQPVGRFRAQTTGTGTGAGWNVFVWSEVFTRFDGAGGQKLDLAAGVHSIGVSVSNGDGYGLEADCVRLQKQ